MDWFQGSVDWCQGSALPPWIFNLYMDGVMVEVRENMGDVGVSVG